LGWKSHPKNAPYTIIWVEDMHMDQPIRWGIIGCGDVTEVKSGPGFQKARGSSLVAVMRRNGELARDYAARHGVPKWTADAGALISDPEVDAVYIATPPSSHKQYTLLAAQAGKPVYVEKPMALSSADCDEMITACQKAGVPLFVAYYRRTLPRFIKVKELVEAGALGEVRYVTVELSQRPPEAPLTPEQIPWRLRPEISGGGHFMDLACHTLDFLDYVLGPIAQASGSASNLGGFYPAEDMVSGAFVFQCGAHGTGAWCFTSYTPVDRVEIAGSHGRLSFASFANEPVCLINAAGRQEFSIDHPAHVQQPLIQQIVDELRGEGQCVSTGVNAARTTWVMEQMLK
jgi:predicted dehydrogenase